MERNILTEMNKNIEMVQKIHKNSFLFQQLVNRDFKHKYKRTIFGMAWSVLSPLLTLLVMRLVFYNFFGRTTPHYTTYLFCGNIVMSYYREATKNGMTSLMHNSNIITKINFPKYLFLLSSNISALINFGLTLIVFFLFCIIDGITFTPKMFLLIYPILCLLIMNIGVGMILSALFVFFKDISYLYDVFLTLLTYVSAIFYTIDSFPMMMQRLYLLNPVYCIIKYFRLIVIDEMIPSLAFHGLCALYAIVLLLLGCYIYKRYNHEFIYYM